MSFKTLLIDPSLCTGCRTCEMACSLYHEGACSPQLSRTRVIKFEAQGKNFPTACSHCSKPQCLTACDQGAISVQRSTGAVVVDEARCTGCRSCLTACPQSMISFHPQRKVALKCDLCGGDPQCARFCPTGAIAYAPVDQFVMARRRELASRSLREGISSTESQKSVQAV
ncbi:MAG: 4Fe-4S dicluster domain-containing protein [Methanosarcinales archaeon]|nr:4Fe-4S dicluster domain-containing protein [Methanosarcinales archaeon]